MILFINACVLGDSRTKKLADFLMSKTSEPIDELRLEDIEFPKVDEGFLNKRDALISKREFDNSMFDLARQFAQADKIVIAAPYWDLSFPSSLKQYIEQINVNGVTFTYSDEGVPVGLCKAAELYYVTTAGGNFVPEEFGYGYVKALANSFYGIDDVKLIKAVGLDIVGADEAIIIQKCMNKIKPI